MIHTSDVEQVEAGGASEGGASAPLSVAARVLCAPIRGYQAVRAGRPSPCRYWPTCSAYALQSIEAHGALRGGWLAARRLFRCRPWAGSGFDPVPEPGR